MLLRPTLNRTLCVPYYNIPFIFRKDKKDIQISTTIYQYEINQNNIVIKDTEKVLFGLKQLSRTGVKSKDNSHYTIEYNTLNGHFKNSII